MGKNKLARWTEFGAFENVIEPKISDVSGKDHPVKGNWNKTMFKNENPIILELGCGKGEYTVGLATRFRENNYIGIDIKGARMWRGAKSANEQNLQNVAFLRTRIEFINSFFTSDEVDEIWITFPDPHPGGRNSNKRLTSPQQLNSYRQLLKNNGLVHLKTDNAELYNFTKSVVIHNRLESVVSTNDLYSEYSNPVQTKLTSDIYLSNDQSVPEDVNIVPQELLSIKTHYEKIFLNKGLKINYISFRLEKDKIIEYAPRKAKS